MKGSCLCSQIQYQITLPLLDSGYCHCTLCRRASGAPVVAWGTVPIESLQILRGKPMIFQSTERGTRQFCGHCGTQLTFQYTRSPKTIDFTLGSLEDPNQVPPRYHIWTESRIEWFDTIDKTPRHEGQGPDTWE